MRGEVKEQKQRVCVMAAATILEAVNDRQPLLC